MKFFNISLRRPSGVMKSGWDLKNSAKAEGNCWDEGNKILQETHSASWPDGATPPMTACHSHHIEASARWLSVKNSSSRRPRYQPECTQVDVTLCQQALGLGHHFSSSVVQLNISNCQSSFTQRPSHLQAYFGVIPSFFCFLLDVTVEPVR